MEGDHARPGPPLPEEGHGRGLRGRAPGGLPVRLRVPVAGLLAALLLTGCAQSVDPIERLGKKAAQRVHP
ncbi:hypothetical protein ACFVJ9_54660, partial [Streptomyces sp. NPDC127574]